MVCERKWHALNGGRPKAGRNRPPRQITPTQRKEHAAANWAVQAGTPRRKRQQTRSRADGRDMTVLMIQHPQVPEGDSFENVLRRRIDNLTDNNILYLVEACDHLLAGRVDGEFLRLVDPDVDDPFAEVPDEMMEEVHEQIRTMLWESAGRVFLAGRRDVAEVEIPCEQGEHVYSITGGLTCGDPPTDVWDDFILLIYSDLF